MPGSEDPAPRKSASGPTHRWVSPNAGPSPPLPDGSFTPHSPTTGTTLDKGTGDKEYTLRNSPEAERNLKLCSHVARGASRPQCEWGGGVGPGRRGEDWSGMCWGAPG